MDVREYADSNCLRCKGRGIVKGEKQSERAVCLCVQVGNQQQATGRRLDHIMSPRARRMTFETFETGGIAQNQRALEAGKQFVNHFERAAEKGWVLGFHGQPRAGKTHLAVAIAQAASLRYRDLTPQLLNLPRALHAERERYNNEDAPSPLQEAQRADLLVLDDLGAEYQKQEDSSRVSWLSEQLYDLLDSRLMSNRPLIYTTNLSPSDMERRFDNEEWMRVYSRLESAQVCPPLEILKVKGQTGADALAKQLLHAPRDTRQDTIEDRALDLGELTEARTIELASLPLEELTT